MTVLRDGEQFVTLNGVRHWYRVAGAERKTMPLMAVHGGPGGNHYVFERTVGLRLETFTTVVYYEQRGSGRSSPPENPEDYSIPLLVSDLEALRRELGLERMNLIGYSFGGELALEYALAYPEVVNRLVLQAPSVNYPGRDVEVRIAAFPGVARGAILEQIERILAEPLPVKEKHERIWAVMDTETSDRFLFVNRDVARMNRALWDAGPINTGEMDAALQGQSPRESLLERAPQLRAPTLILVGRHDRNTGLEISRDLASSIPDAHLEVFERSAHFPDLEEPEKYARLVREFLTSDER